MEVVLAASILVVVGVISIAGFLFFTRNQSVSGNYGELSRNANVIQETIMLDLEGVSRVSTFDVTADPMVANGPWKNHVDDATTRSWVLKLKSDAGIEDVTYSWNKTTGTLTRSESGAVRVFENVFDITMSNLVQHQVTVSGRVNEYWLLGSGALGQEATFSGTAVVMMR